MRRNALCLLSVIFIFTILYAVDVFSDQPSETLQIELVEPSFTDITNHAGTGGPVEPGRTGGHGPIFADINGDGLPDLYVTMNFASLMADLFFRNRGGNVFTEEGALRGIGDFDGGSHGAVFADLDNDGDYDLFNGTTNHTSEYPAWNDIFQNDGRGKFSDVTMGSGIPSDRSWPTRAVLAFDMDRDGDLDLFGVSNYLGSGDPPGELNEVYLNQGDFRFIPITTGALVTAPCGQGATDTDIDGDGDIDVICGNRTGDLNILINDGSGSFRLIPPGDAGVFHRGGDGISTGDVDNDGDLDMLLTSDNEGFLYLNRGNGTFQFHQDFYGTSGYMGGFADLNNDGYLDLIFSGDSKVYLNDTRGNYVPGPSVPASGIQDPRGIAFSDIDNDGDLDFAVGCQASRNILIRNNLNGGNWLKVRLLSPQGQAGAFGAKIQVYPAGEAGGTLLGMREICSNTGYLGQNDPVSHFGLGQHRSADVVVTFLDGSMISRSGVTSGQTVTINGGLDIDNDGVSDAEEMGPGSTDINYDGDQDGIADSLQNTVVSLYTLGRTHYVTMKSSDPLSHVKAIELPVEFPGETEFPYGFLEFAIHVLSPGGSALVSLYLDGEIPDTYYKYGGSAANPIPDWYSFLYDPQSKTGAEFDGFIVNLHFVDGERGDDDTLADGTIIDQGGPGISGVSPPVVPPPVVPPPVMPPPSIVLTGDSSGGCTIANREERSDISGAYAILGLIVLFSGLRGIRRTPRYRSRGSK